MSVLKMLSALSRRFVLTFFQTSVKMCKRSVFIITGLERFVPKLC